MKKIFLLTFLAVSFLTQARQIGVYGTKRNVTSSGNVVVFSCNHAPIVCAIIEVPEGPNEQFRCTIYNPDHTVDSSYEITNYSISEDDAGPVVTLELP